MQPTWRVLLLDTKRSNPNHYLCLALRDALSVHPSVAQVTLAGYGNALDCARRGDFNLFLAFDGEELDETLCARVAQRCGRSLLWVTEDPYERAVNVARARLFDLVLTNDSASVAAYPAGRARHLPLAASEAWHWQELPPAGGEPHRYLYDVFFAGTAWPNRVALLRALLAALPELKCKIALPHNEHLAPPDLGGALPPSALDWRAPNSEFCRLANRSRITLGLHRDFSASEGNPSMAQTPGPRLFEVALAGGFQLVDGRLAEVGRYYKEGSEFAAFADAADCLEKVRYYLAHAEEREAMARAAQQVTRERHLYRHRVDQLLAWAAELPAPAATTPATDATIAGRRNVLFVAHNTIASEHFGGVEVAMNLLARDLREEFNFFYYVPVNRDHASVGAILYGPGLLELRRFNFPPIRDNVLLSCPAREAAFAQVLSDCAIDLAHFHHLIGHVPSLPLIARAYGLPTALTLHDYHHACTSFNLLDYERRFCHIEDRPMATCDVCLSAQFHYPRGSQERRRAFFARVFDAIDALFFGSEDCRNRFQRIYAHTDLASKSTVVKMPVPSHGKALSAGAGEQGRWTPPYRVICFGNFTHAKGADVLLRVFNQLRESPFEFHLYGRLDNPYPEILEALRLPNVFVHRQFAPGSLDLALQQAALSLHVSVWPETFCITLSEAMGSGVVPIVSDLGALGERVAHGINGFKIPPESPGELLDLLERLAADPSPAMEIGKALAAQRAPGASEHADAMATHYRALLAGVPAAPKTGGGFLSASLTLADCGCVLANPSWCLEPPPPVLVSGAIGDLARAATAPADRPLVTDPALFFNPAFIWRRAVQQTRDRGLRGAARWHGKVLLKLMRGNGNGSRGGSGGNGNGNGSANGHGNGAPPTR